MKQLVFIILVFASFLKVDAQGPNHEILEETKVLIKGRIIEQVSQMPVGYATVAILSKESKVLIAGTSTDMDGRFEVTALNKDVILEASFIGYETFTVTDIKFTKGVADLGDIVISPSSQIMDEVTVRAERSTTEFKLDKRVFNVGQDLSSTGASALEVLNNVPSVTVGIEGDIKLRGNGGVQMLLMGNPLLSRINLAMPWGPLQLI